MKLLKCMALVGAVMVIGLNAEAQRNGGNGRGGRPDHRMPPHGRMSPAVECLTGLARLVPQYRDGDRQWVCGLSSNSPVYGAGNDPTYVDCLLDVMENAPFMKDMSDVAMNQCRAYGNQRYDYTRYMPTAVYCMSELNYLAPEYRNEDLKWVCGVSSNSPSKNRGEDYNYTSCLIDSLEADYTNKDRADLMMSRCDRFNQERGPQTDSMPVALYCVSSLREIVPSYREEDARWVCGVSSNSPQSRYGDIMSYGQCVVNTLSAYPEMSRNSSDQVMSSCAQKADRRVDMPRRGPINRRHGPSSRPSRPQRTVIITPRGNSTPGRTTISCPSGYRWDARSGRCTR